MLISDDDAPTAPGGPAMGILLKGLGAGAVLGTFCGAVLLLDTGAGSPAACGMMAGWGK
ncbi:hypothetical protein [uncultured Arthrobacter sp.]|uniref:hypothetical protein n=1 Tax=uncultured Arthrobacter sp. TaxID=114050 RepID=UPI002600BAB2|nr:hypothetical protein [uncultured Arthrobacter sp.]